MIVGNLIVMEVCFHYTTTAYRCPNGGALWLFCLLALIAAFLWVIGGGTRSRPQPHQRNSGPMQPPRIVPVGICERCRSRLLPEAAYCARCGMPVSRPVPIPLPQPRPASSGFRWLVYLLIIILGLFVVSVFWRASESQPSAPISPPPVYPHQSSDPW
jgi:ribosomal protein L40E